jgi:hypothetical protein
MGPFVTPQDSTPRWFYFFLVIMDVKNAFFFLLIMDVKNAFLDISKKHESD